jgi:hypothetical protein
VKNSSGLIPCVRVDRAGSGVVSQSGGVLLVDTIRAVGLGRVLSAALAPWRTPTARYHPAKVLPDLAVELAVGGDCLADIARLRAEPGVFGRVASDPTVSRMIDALAADADRALKAINSDISQVGTKTFRQWKQIAETPSPPPQVAARTL